MAAIVRVKRRRDADPAESLLISCKRHRQDDPGSPADGPVAASVKQIFKFAATISDKEEETVSQHIRDAIRKEKLQKEYKHHQLPLDIPSKVRRDQRAAAEHNRYRVIAQRRALNLEGLDIQQPQVNEAVVPCLDIAQLGSSKKRNCDEMRDEKVDSSLDQDKVFCLYDLEADDPRKKSKFTKVAPEIIACNEVAMETITCNGVAMERIAVPPSASSDAESTEDYVYDLYYLNKQDFDFRMLENILAIEAYNIQFEDLRHPEEEDYYQDDDDDSNDEGNWRNDYPDEDPLYYENDDTEYYVGDDGHGFQEAFEDEDVWEMSERLQKGCFMDDDIETNPYYDSEGHQPHTSYDAYKKRVLQELSEEKDPENDTEKT